MKKITLMAFATLAAFGAAHADFQGAPAATKEGGFVAGKDTIVTVSQAKEMRDDVDVILQGKILRQTGDDKYLFEDQTGTITVEIEKKGWRGQNITPEDTVKLYGEVDRGILKTEIDVDYVEKM